MYTYNVWDTIDVIFRRERREKALHHSSLSLKSGHNEILIALYIILKDKQHERMAVLSRSHLKALCAFAPNALYVYYI